MSPCHCVSELLMAEANFFISSHKLSLWHIYKSLWRRAICCVISDHNLAYSVTAPHKSLHISWPCRFFLSHIRGRWPFSTQLKYVLLLLSLYCGYYILVSLREGSSDLQKSLLSISWSVIPLSSFQENEIFWVFGVWILMFLLLMLLRAWCCKRYAIIAI